MNTNIKSITPATVCQAATALIRAEGGTSILLVQQFLRNQGYQTRQAEVSKWLSAVALQEGWSINDAGLFQVYAFSTRNRVPHKSSYSVDSQ